MAASYLKKPVSDWPLGRLLAVCAIFCVLTSTLIVLTYAGCDVPVLRPIAGFIFLTSIPGALIMRILRIHKIGILESMVYMFGLSIAFVMVSGALIDLLLPLAGVRQPLTLLPVTVAYEFLVLILMLLAWIRDKGFIPGPEETTVEKLSLIPVLTLLLLISLTVLGAAVNGVFQNNILLLICLAGIVVIVGLAAFDRFIRPVMYPLTIFTIGLCLLYQTTLMSPYPIGSDIFTEHQFYRLAADSGLWDGSIPSIVNSCLSITILAPVYSLIMGVDGNWLFKIVYPLIFALVPLILFEVFNRQIGPKKAFLSVFFFVSVPTFSIELIALCRQQIAELFLALIVLLLVDRKLSTWQKTTALIIFTLSMIVSHYALGLIGFAYFVILVLGMLFFRSRLFGRLWGRAADEAGESLFTAGSVSVKSLILVIAVYLVAASCWYGLAGAGLNASMFKSIWAEQTGIITTQIDGIVHATGQAAGQASSQTSAAIQFFNRDGLIRTALGLDFAEATPAGKVFRILQYITQLLLVIGILKTLFRPGKSGFKPEFLSLSIAGVCLILASLIIPRFADYLNITRLYHLALMTLAPFCILGGVAVWEWAISVRRKTKRSYTADHFDSVGCLRFVTLVVLIPYFLFTAGIVYEVTGHSMTEKADLPYSIALSSYRLDLAGVLSSRDGAAAQWAGIYSDNTTSIHADRHAANLLSFYQFPGRIQELRRDADDPTAGSLVYLNGINLEREQITIAVSTGLRQFVAFKDISGLEEILTLSHRVYGNGGAQVLFCSVP